HHAIGFSDVLAYGATFTLVSTGNDDDFIAFHNLSHRYPYRTSGASDTMRMNCFSRSSRPTGPKIRVPRGAFCALISTAALSSNLMWLPSGRPYSLEVRTITARTTSPFLTAPFGCALLTEAMMTSPTPPYLREEPPRTRMHMISRAPLLS